MIPPPKTCLRFPVYSCHPTLRILSVNHTVGARSFHTPPFTFSPCLLLAISSSSIQVATSTSTSFPFLPILFRCVDHPRLSTTVPCSSCALQSVHRADFLESKAGHIKTNTFLTDAAILAFFHITILFIHPLCCHRCFLLHLCPKTVF
jgi:hypothetical protein